MVYKKITPDWWLGAGNLWYDRVEKEVEPMTVGQRIAQKRKELGLSQEGLGERLGPGAACRGEACRQP